MDGKGIGRKVWAIPGGHIPMGSAEPEPEFTSRDELCLLNTNEQPAQVEITIYYSTADPVGPYRLTVQPRRVRHVRMNDLIDPQAMPLDTPYASVIEADVPIVVQFYRLDSRRAENAILGTIAYPVDE
ncbi:MAG: sensory rhodopsin transducer [Chloroflexi bacterium]|jgi:hypothetical protein|nr:sensory rhodopsin transducer [Chloroflexota bacterium]